jgi:hypothetical protein
MVIALGVITGCSYSTGEVLKTGISASQAQLYSDKGNLTVYPNDTEIISDVDKKTIHFGYVHLESAAKQYMEGKAIVATAGYMDTQKQVWVLITSPDLIQTNRSAVQEAVRTILNEAKQNGYTVVKLDENMVNQFLHISNKVNLSWFVDQSFINIEKNKN